MRNDSVKHFLVVAYTVFTVGLALFVREISGDGAAAFALFIGGWFARSLLDCP